MEDLAALSASGDELLRRLAFVRRDDLAKPSVCDGWSIFDLVNHVIGGAARYRLIIDGASVDEVQSTRGADHVGDDPVVALAALAAPLAESFAAPGVLERTFRHPAGERTGLALLRMRITDQALHAVDLARSLGLDDRLDAELVGYLLDSCAPMFDAGRAAGFFGPEREVAPDATPQQRLLALAGR